MGGESDAGLLVSNDEGVSLSSGESFSVGVLQVSDVEAVKMPLNVDDLGNSSDVVSTGDVGEVSGFVFEPLRDLVLFQVELDSVSFVDFGVGESDGPAVVSDDVGDFVGTNSLSLDLEEFVSGFSVLDLDEGETSLDVVEKTVVLASLGEGDGIHDADGELEVFSSFIIDFDPSLFILNDEVGLAGSEGYFQVVPALIHMYLRTMERGRHSLSLWGPWLGLVA